jgi:hypothetical protein
MDLVAAAADTTSTSYQVGGWVGRLALLLLVVLLVRKYVFRKEAPRIGRSRQEEARPAASMAGRVGTRAGVASTPATSDKAPPREGAAPRIGAHGSANILPAPPSAARQKRQPD